MSIIDCFREAKSFDVPSHKMKDFIKRRKDGEKLFPILNLIADELDKEGYFLTIN